MEQHTFFQAEKLENGVTRISDLSGVHCYLVEGEKKAVLIDAMTGLRGLPEFTASLTSLPVEVAVTHGHLDHVGGVFEFGSCTIHPADIPMLEGDRHGSTAARKGYVDSMMAATQTPIVYTEADFTQQCPVEYRPVTAGMMLDLGGRKLEVIEVPGHTKGSVCYLDSVSGDFFSGDACNSNTLIMMEGSATIGEYLEALKKLKLRQPEIKTYHLFHGPTPQANTCIDDNIECCEAILAGTDDHIEVEFLGRTGYIAKDRENYMRKDGRFGNIMYTMDRVR